jgi:aspartate-semialdehyde dehydrogenase
MAPVSDGRIAMTTTALSVRKDIKDKRLVRSFAYVGGKWRGAASGATFAVTDPATGDYLGEVARLSAAESGAAVDDAQAAFPAWAGRLPQDRSRLLRLWFDQIVEHRDDLARIMVLEQGKPCRRPWARSTTPRASSSSTPRKPSARTSRASPRICRMPRWSCGAKPVGVAALVTPWNFPSAMLTRKAAAALAAGCTVRRHPSSETPFSALALANWRSAPALPAGVFNVVTGHAPDIVEPWTRDPRVRALSFTGSTDVGRLLYRQSAPTIKRLVLELGGHAPVHRFRGCRSGQGGRRDDEGQVRDLRAGLPRRQPHLRRTPGLRPLLRPSSPRQGR